MLSDNGSCPFPRSILMPWTNASMCEIESVWIKARAPKRATRSERDAYIYAWVFLEEGMGGSLSLFFSGNLREVSGRNTNIFANFGKCHDGVLRITLRFTQKTITKGWFAVVNSLKIVWTLLDFKENVYSIFLWALTTVRFFVLCDLPATVCQPYCIGGQLYWRFVWDTWVGNFSTM